jgi:phosphatidylglycerophosphatase A
MIKLAKIISTFFGLGLFPVGPGTIASIAVVLIYKFSLFRLAWPFYLLLLILITAVGVYTSTIFARALSLKDPGKIVIDEVAGQLIAVFALRPDWSLLIASFILFRIFDIIKPLGVKKLENLPWGWGIMADDLASGLAVNLLLHLAVVIFKI